MMKQKRIHYKLFIIALLLAALPVKGKMPGNMPGKISAVINNINGTRPYHNNPWYWEYKWEPIMLMGASDRDNLVEPGAKNKSWKLSGRISTVPTGGDRNVFTYLAIVKVIE